MKVINPTTVTDSILTSSTVAENDFAVWNAATSYTIGTKIIRLTTHRIYQNLIAGVDATLPENATGGSSPRWLDVSPTNRWAIFDDEVGSRTTATTSITYVLAPGLIEGIAFLEITAETIQVQMKDVSGGSVIYDQTFNLDGSIITSFYDWFYEPYITRNELSITDLPKGYFSPELTIVITGTGTVSCGVCKFGIITALGGTEYGATLGLISYSRKEVNDFGRIVIVPRRFIKTLEVKLFSDALELSRIYRTLSELKDTPCVWIGSDANNYESLTLYGFYNDFSIDISYPTANYCTLKIEGLI
jgi:hypothetical protein